ncbi:MAG: V-type ATP synthase subunit B, partial [Promethearchaeota archaeon]
ILLEARDLLSVVGEDGLTLDQKLLLKFGEDFEQIFLNQNPNENRSFNQTFTRAWRVLSNLSRDQLFRIHQEFIDKYYVK